MIKNSTQQQEINRRRQIVSKLRHEGVKTQADIVQRLKDDYGFEVTQQTVSNDLKALDKLWRISAIDEIDKWKKEIAAQYRYIYQQSLTAWELSLEDAEETTTGGKDGPTEKVKGQSGNPALLAQAQAALKAIREMFGVDAAAKQEYSGQVDLVGMSLEEWRKEQKRRQDEATETLAIFDDTEAA